MTNILLLIGAYFALLLVLSIAVRPTRVRLAQLANELAADYPDKRLVMALCKAYLGSAYSMRAAPQRLLSYLVLLLRPAHQLDRECEDAQRQNPEFFNDPRILEMMECYSASTAAASPIFGALAAVARLLFRLKALMHYRAMSQDRALTEFADLRAAT